MGKQQVVVSKEELEERERRRTGENVVIELRQYLKHSESLNGMYNNLKIELFPNSPFQLNIHRS